MLFSILLFGYLYCIETSLCSNLINRALSIFFTFFFYPSYIHSLFVCFSTSCFHSLIHSLFINLFIRFYLSFFLHYLLSSIPNFFLPFFHASFITSFLSFPQTMGGLETLTSLQSLWMGKNKIEELGGGKCRYSCTFTLLPCI